MIRVEVNAGDFSKEYPNCFEILQDNLNAASTL